ncbi:MAG: serine/threonine protein kinase, partial [Chloroflexi bacterium]
MIDRIGQRLGHYRLTRKLGSGGFADVYQAEHIYLNTLAAVKLLNANLASGDIQNFHNEARTIARLAHPHIVRILDFGMEESIPYLVMEYAPNGTMRQRHPKGTQVPLSLIVKYVRQVASALQHAHTHRLIHRDVKPENLLLGGNNELLLGDFGAALLTRTSLMLSAQNIIGTISYMAPEQLQGRPSPASDQYALGIVVYEWLCGSCPFQGPLAVVHNLQLYEPPPSLRARIPTLSPAIELVVMKALAKQPEQRFVTVQAFAQALEQASQHIQAPPPPLILSGNGGVQGHTVLQATETVLAPSPVPLTMVAPRAAPPFPVTIIANASRPIQPRHTRRVFLSSLIGLAAIGGAGALGLWMAQQGGQTKPPTPTGPQHVPTPKATPIPTKSHALYTYTGHQ